VQGIPNKCQHRQSFDQEFSVFLRSLVRGSIIPQIIGNQSSEHYWADIEPKTNAALVPVAISLTPLPAPIAPEKFGVSGALSALLTSPAALLYSMRIAAKYPTYACVKPLY
jgi:hypothetical protein